MLLGIGLGGFVDGIVFHQILQWHHFFSHYSLLHTAERLLGYHRYIGHADDPLATGMSRAFGL